MMRSVIDIWLSNPDLLTSCFNQGEDKSDQECQFTVHKENRKGFLSLESVKMPGVFLGIGDTGKVKHAVDAGDVTACLSVEITSCKLTYDFFLSFLHALKACAGSFIVHFLCKRKFGPL